MVNSITSKTIEWLRFFCIVVVVLLHAVGSPMDGREVISYHNGVYDTIRILFSEGFCRIAVPTFFLISGYLFFFKLEEWSTDIWFNKLKKRVRTLLIPYLLWNLIAIIVSLMLLLHNYVLGSGVLPGLIKLAGLEHFGIRDMEDNQSIILCGLSEI